MKHKKTNALLAERELKVLKLWAQENTKPEIADEIKMSTHTVDADLRKIYKKLGVRTRHGAVLQGFLKNVITKKDFVK